MPIVPLARDAMRTRWEILLYDPSANAADLRAAGEEALSEVERVERLLSAFHPGAEIFTVNARAADAPVRVSPPTFALISRAQALCVATEGAFDPTVGPLLRLWGLLENDAGRVPSPDEIAGTLRCVGMAENVFLDADALTVSFARKGVRLDLGAIGKGYALDRAASVLRDAGIVSALLHGGTSSVLGLGTPPDRTDGWRVAVQHPNQPGEKLGVVVLQNAALSVSAAHGKSFWAQNQRFGHILDGRTGRPVEKSVLAAIVAPNGGDTDALSTALLVQGERGLPDLAARFPHAAFCIVEEDPTASDGLRVSSTPDFFYAHLKS